MTYRESGKPHERNTATEDICLSLIKTPGTDYFLRHATQSFDTDTHRNTQSTTFSVQISNLKSVSAYSTRNSIILIRVTKTFDCLCKQALYGTLDVTISYQVWIPHFTNGVMI